MFAIFPTNNNGLNVTNVVELTLTGADEIWAPTNYPGFGPPPTNHQKFEMWVYQDATGNHLPSFTTSSNSPPYYYFGSDITGVLVTTNAGKATVIAWEYDAPWTNWNCVGVLHKMGGP